MSITSVKEAVWRKKVRYSEDPFKGSTDPWSACEEMLPQEWFDDFNNQQRDSQAFDAAFQDCYHVLIVENGPMPAEVNALTNDFESFFDEIIQVVVRSYGYKDPSEMFIGEVDAMFKGFEWLSCAHGKFLGEPPDPEDYTDSYKGNCLAGVDYTLGSRKMFRDDVSTF
ncbi:BQ2448_5675 [Microbotryum intermedium]|uniref:BQ2448_5675 protein n=1 Tax=Microbotryum intermedium TaxID=269621 RepID=A0A238F2U1_9BASI|nr:BQ2448_5675 [Microbotryum intermedium]